MYVFEIKVKANTAVGQSIPIVQSIFNGSHVFI